MNIGGAKPHFITKATMGHPAQYTFCVGENEEESPWEPLHVEKGFRPDQRTVTLFGGHSPLQINDHASRTAEQLALSIGWTMANIWNHKNFPVFSDTTLIVCPEHAKTFAEDGWLKSDLRQFLFEKIRKPFRELKPGVNGGEGVGVSMIPLPNQSKEPPTDDTLYPKFPALDSIMIIVAGDQIDRGAKSFAPRLDTLVGKTVALLDINKSKGVYFLDRVEEVLRERYGVKEVLRRKKVSAGKMASEQIKQECGRSVTPSSKPSAIEGAAFRAVRTM